MQFDNFCVYKIISLTMVTNKGVLLLTLVVLLSAWNAAAATMPCPGCVAVDAANKCIECKAGYLLLRDKGECYVITSIKEASSVSVPATTVTTSTSYSSQSSANTIALSIRDVDLNCKNADASGRCQTCHDRFYWNRGSGRCESVHPFCRNWDNDGLCLKCFEGYKFEQSICSPIVQSTISTNYQYNSGSSYQSSSSSSQTRNYGATSTGSVTTSIGGGSSKITQGSTGQQSVGVVVANCAEANGNYCVKCAFRFYNSNGVCYKVSDQCKSWSLTTGACVDCYDGYVLSGTQCVLKPASSSNSNSQYTSSSYIIPSIDYNSNLNIYNTNSQSNTNTNSNTKTITSSIDTITAYIPSSTSYTTTTYYTGDSGTVPLFPSSTVLPSLIINGDSGSSSSLPGSSGHQGHLAYSGLSGSTGASGISGLYSGDQSESYTSGGYSGSSSSSYQSGYTTQNYSYSSSSSSSSGSSSQSSSDPALDTISATTLIKLLQTQK